MDNSEFKDSFINETTEYLEILNHTLLELEKKPADAQSIQEMFRIVHSLKSMAAGMEYDQISDLAHQMETVFERFRSTASPVPSGVIDLLFECLDALTVLLREVSAEKPENLDILPLIQKLSLLVN